MTPFPRALPGFAPAAGIPCVSSGADSWMLPGSNPDKENPERNRRLVGTKHPGCILKYRRVWLKSAGRCMVTVLLCNELTS